MVCSRAALMSGRHEFKNGVTHTILERERMALSTFTLPQMLKSVGYTSGIFGKWHLGDEEAYRPESRGFDEVYIHGGGGIGQTYPGTCGDAPGNTNIDPSLWHNGKWVKTKGYCTDLFFAQAIKWMNAQREAKQPFFAYIPLNAANGPHVLPKEYYQEYLGKEGVLVNEKVQDIPNINPLKALYWKQFGGGPDEAMLKQMDPSKSAIGKNDPSATPPKRQRKRDDSKS